MNVTGPTAFSIAFEAAYDAAKASRETFAAVHVWTNLTQNSFAGDAVLWNIGAKACQVRGHCRQNSVSVHALSLLANLCHW